MTVDFAIEGDEKISSILEGLNWQDLLEKVIISSLEYEGCPYEAEVHVILTDNESICEINREHRRIGAPTDVLSFPMVEYPAPGDFSGLEDSALMYFHPDTGELILGDIVISVEMAQAQAEAYGHTLERELAFLTAHSMLHLFGYDHIDDAEGADMEKHQEEILTALGIGR